MRKIWVKTVYSVCGQLCRRRRWLCERIEREAVQSGTSPLPAELAAARLLGYLTENRRISGLLRVLSDALKALPAAQRQFAVEHFVRGRAICTLCAQTGAAEGDLRAARRECISQLTAQLQRQGLSESSLDWLRGYEFVQAALRRNA